MIATNLEIGERLCVDKITSVQHPGGRRVQDLPEPERTELPFLTITILLLFTVLQDSVPPIHHSFFPEISEYIHFLTCILLFFPLLVSALLPVIS